MSEEIENWIKDKPECIKEAVRKLPPDKLYKFKDSGKQCYLISYEEPDDVNVEVTVTVQKTGVGSIPGTEELNMNQVFGVSLNNLEPYG